MTSDLLQTPSAGPAHAESDPSAASQTSFAMRVAVLVYGLVAYTAFAVTITYAIGFVAGLGVQRTIDTPSDASLGSAVTVNLGILGLFAVQHSIMARGWFKRRWTRIVAPAIERSTFVLITCAILTLLFTSWQSIAGDVWRVEHPMAAAVLWTLCGAGWALVVVATFLIDHFDLFGVKQVLRYFRGTPHEQPPFLVRSIYRRVRHPLYLGFMLAFWATPHMTWGHLLFAVATTAFMLVAVRFEEVDLIRAHGDDYLRYRERVPMILPTPGRSW